MWLTNFTRVAENPQVSQTGLAGNAERFGFTDWVLFRPGDDLSFGTVQSLAIYPRTVETALPEKSA